MLSVEDHYTKCSYAKGYYSVVVMARGVKHCYAGCNYANCTFAEGHYAEGHYLEGHYA